MTSYTVSGVPGVTYYITVFAVNVLGPGPNNGFSIVNGEIMINIITINFICHAYAAVSIFPTTATTNTQLVNTQTIASIIIGQNIPTSTGK